MAYKSLAHKILSIASSSEQAKRRIVFAGKKIREEKKEVSLSELDNESWGRVKEVKENFLTRFFEKNAKRSSAAQAGKDVFFTEIFAADIGKSMKISPNKDVLEAMNKMCSKSDQKIFQEAFDFVRPPYPNTWIEFSDNNIHYGILISEELNETGELSALRVNMLYDYNLKNPDAVPYSDYSRGYIVTKDNIAVGDRNLNAPLKKDYGITSFFLDMRDRHYGMMRGDRNLEKHSTRFEVKVVLSLLLLLNSRSRMLKITQPKSLKKTFQSEIKPRTIEFDIERLLEKSKEKLNSDEAKTHQAEALVRGHFKVRKTGVFWWSPYIRNKKSSTKIDNNKHLDCDRTAVVSGDGSTISLPTAEQ